MAAISLDDVRRSSSLVIALPRVDDCLVPQSTAVEGSGHLLARAVIIPWAETRRGTLRAGATSDLIVHERMEPDLMNAANLSAVQC
jgi:hypothetical protein